MAILPDPSHTERELLDTIERAGRTPAGRTAVHLHLSRLLPSNRPPTHLRIAARLLGALERTAAARVFALSNGDIVILGKDLPDAPVDLLVHRVRSLFDHDPLTWQAAEDPFAAGAESRGGDDPFVTWYALEVDFEALHAQVQALLEAAEATRQRQLHAPPPPRPLAPGDLDDLAAKLGRLNIRHVLKRQPCVGIEGNRARLLFEEVTISIPEVREAIAPDIDLFADRWLFQDFSRQLDAAMLKALPQTDVIEAPPGISLNLNLDSLDSPDFQGLLNVLDGRRLLAEVRIVDVIANIAAYCRLRDSLRARGHGIVIDGLGPANLGAMELGRLDPDYVKVLWMTDLAAPHHGRDESALTAAIAALGPERVILSRCDSEAAVTWGLRHGIAAFQGRFLDAVLAAVTLHACPGAAACTIRACATRRTSVAGPRRRECPHPPGLDMIQEFAAPGRRPAAAPTTGRAPA